MFEIENFEHLRRTFEVENFELFKKNDTGPHMFCVLQWIGSNSYSNLPLVPFFVQKSMVLDGWMDGKAGLRIAYSNKKLVVSFGPWFKGKFIA